MKKKSIAFIISVLFLSGQISAGISFTKAAAQPYQRTFIVTAYYSPIEGQEFYVTGSLASDKRLNGNGTNGADGTPVYSGMIAAPGIYSFGTRVSCPGYIDGEIHDRGGAIVKAGQRGYAHDRLDFWAGHGDAALKTALYWGKRTLTCTVYPPGTSPDFQQYVSLPNAPKTYGKPQMAQRAPNIVQTSAVTARYKSILNDLGYDAEDKASRIAFQIRHGIIDSPTEAVAGNVGPATKSKLDSIAGGNKTIQIKEGLEEGDVNSDVRQLQEHLIELGYLNTASTAIFGPATKEALIAFQMDKDLIDSAEHPAAGYVGPGTSKAFGQSENNEYLISATDKELIKTLNIDKIAAESLAKANSLDAPENEGTEVVEDFSSLLEDLSQEWIKEHTPDAQSSQAKVKLASASSENYQLNSLRAKLAPMINPFSKHLQLGSTGEDVRKIQQLLSHLGYFEGAQITNFFGPQTRQAIVDFQVDQQIVASHWYGGAGLVGPKTVQALNASFYQMQYSLPVAESKSFRAPAIHPEDLIQTKPLQQAKANQAS
jgi:peptidoglycan hydrolase-like protein with peptidoglycan-binding domain